MASATAYLRKKGIHAHLADSILTRESLDSYFHRIRTMPFDYVVIETSSPSINIDLTIAQEVAKHRKVILAGPHATIYADELMAEHPFIFGVVKGEYEQNLHRLLEEGKGGVYDYDLMDNLDDLPFPYRDTTIYRYSDRFPNTPPGPALQVIASRGCPFACIFCLWPPVMFQNRYRQRQPGAIIAEIEEAFQRFPQLTSVYFDDDTFNIGKKRILEICEGMKRMGIPWSAMCRADTSDRETYLAMKDSGCYAVKFGVESGCQELVDRCNKKLNLQVVEEMVQYAKSIGIFVHITITWGLPGETLSTIRRTREFYRRVRPDSVQQSYCTPFPGTPFYDMAQKAMDLKVVDWGSLDGAQGYVMDTEALTAEELKKYAHLN
jgi:radical SAM superfamily enzyme YgiQ (UPF0313 family)